MSTPTQERLEAFQLLYAPEQGGDDGTELVCRLKQVPLHVCGHSPGVDVIADVLPASADLIQSSLYLLRCHLTMPFRLVTGLYEPVPATVKARLLQ